MRLLQLLLQIIAAGATAARLPELRDAAKPAPRLRQGPPCDRQAPRITPDLRHRARQLAEQFAETAAERDAIRQSGLLSLIIPDDCGGPGSDWQTTLGVVREQVAQLSI
ncbi:hypothetical protein FQZ97_832740 [compost metagenome]